MGVKYKDTDDPSMRLVEECSELIKAIMKGERNMYFEFRAIIGGGMGPDIWDKEVTVGGEDMTIKQALEKIENDLGSDTVVFSIEQAD